MNRNGRPGSKRGADGRFAPEMQPLEPKPINTAAASNGTSAPSSAPAAPSPANISESTDTYRSTSAESQTPAPRSNRNRDPYLFTVHHASRPRRTASYRPHRRGPL
jgi:hypothetical protein